MRLWRLSRPSEASKLDGGYGLRFDGRWNRVGRPVTYCATSPALCVLEKLVHIEDPSLVPALVLVSYDAPNELAVEDIALSDLPLDWRHREIATQAIGDEWLRRAASPLLRVPSVIVPHVDSLDRNFLVNHRHPEANRIEVRSTETFGLDPRLLSGAGPLAGSGQG
jgi:RES domain-containing protein